MDNQSNETPATQSSHVETTSNRVTDHPKPKKRSILEDDFFSLSTSIDRKKRRHKERSRDVSSNSPVTSEQAVQRGEPSLIKRESTNAAHHEQEKKSTVAPQSEPSAKTAPPISKRLATPPLIDKESILREIEQKVSKREGRFSTPLLDDSDEEDVELKTVKSSPKSKNPTNSSLTDHSYKFAEADEKKRRYIIKITSKLPAPEGTTIEVDLGCKGMKSFGKILKSAVDFYTNAYANQLPPVLLDRYNVDECALVWLEGKMLVHSFFTPRMLRIQPPGGAFNALVDRVETMPPTKVHFLLIPKDNKNNFMNVYPELRNSEMEPEVKVVEEPTVAEELSQSSSEDEEDYDESDGKHPSNSNNLDDLANGEEGVFSIGLKGKDNKRISCKVTPETKLESLLKFYLDKKKIDESTVNLASVKMIFDDEELNLNDVVADTELEEDFEIQIVL
ncbi:ESC2 [Candida theae]|uniref:ESC2 n=1 Tax=Candida theae TaxID=1198502 RepID=A0AAD5FXM6_9ASCO|nr:ESC2 [Candida theae]KAI5955473.1 ESC2 [Candida theae]